MSPTIKLVYFPVRGRAEMIRYILHQAGVPFTDEKVQVEDWASKKPMKGPFGQLPYVEIDGQILAQSMTIGRYFAHKFGLAGANEWESALADMYVDGVNDLYQHYLPIILARFVDKDEEKVKAQWAMFKNDHLATFKTQYTKFLEKSSSGWLVGDKVTWADLVVAETLDRYKCCIDSTVLDDCPKLKEHHDRVHNLPNINKYAAMRHQSPG